MQNDPQAEPTPPPSTDQIQVGVSASQLGLSQSANVPRPSTKKIILIASSTIGAIVVLFTVLSLTGVIAFSEFRTVSYANSTGSKFKLQFYSKHSVTTLESGQKQLISRVSNDGAFPLTLSIAHASSNGYNSIRSCTGLVKVFDIQNVQLDRKIAVCDFGARGNLPSGSVYVAGIEHDSQAYIITISQDYSSINISNSAAAQESLTRFGLDPYQDDIKRIIASVQVL